jgi:PD-(D/E)XK endonuclease
MKTRKTTSPARQSELSPLIRGPRNNHARGNLAELAFLLKAARLGFGVARPYGDQEPYDFILDSGERFWRVQVKSSSYAVPGRSGYAVHAWHAGQGCKSKAYGPEEIDFLVAYVVPADAWYIVPANQLASLRFLRVYPSGCRGGGCFESFREAWHLMAPGADLPHPRRLSRVRALDLHPKLFPK